jgi:hypothetical protein
MLTSPLTWRATDPSGRVISATVEFDNATREILDVSVHRDAYCAHDTVLTGVTDDGSPTAVTRRFTVGPGITHMTERDLTSRAIRSIDDLLHLRVTFAPSDL